MKKHRWLFMSGRSRSEGSTYIQECNDCLAIKVYHETYDSTSDTWKSSRATIVKDPRAMYKRECYS